MQLKTSKFAFPNPSKSATYTIKGLLFDNRSRKFDALYYTLFKHHTFKGNYQMSGPRHLSFVCSSLLSLALLSDRQPLSHHLFNFFQSRVGPNFVVSFYNLWYWLIDFTSKTGVSSAKEGQTKWWRT